MLVVAVAVAFTMDLLAVTAVKAVEGVVFPVFSAVRPNSLLPAAVVAAVVEITPLPPLVASGVLAAASPGAPEAPPVWQMEGPAAPIRRQGPAVPVELTTRAPTVLAIRAAQAQTASMLRESMEVALPVAQTAVPPEATMTFPTTVTPLVAVAAVAGTVAAVAAHPFPVTPAAVVVVAVPAM
jgi:hypothetical protein